MYFARNTGSVRQHTVRSGPETYDAVPQTSFSGQAMTFTDAPIAPNTLTITPQLRHRKAAEQHEKAVRHHRQAALLLDAGDERQADTHANIAFSHAVSALETSGMALKA
jgi:hypothetical protein